MFFSWFIVANLKVDGLPHLENPYLTLAVSCSSFSCTQHTVYGKSFKQRRIACRKGSHEADRDGHKPVRAQPCVNISVYLYSNLVGDVPLFSY